MTEEKGLGRTTVAAFFQKPADLADAAADDVAAEVESQSRPGREMSTGSVAEEHSSAWARLRRQVSEQQIGSRPFRRLGLAPSDPDFLPKRARDLLDEMGCDTLGDVVGLDPGVLLRRSNVGRGTLKALLQRAEQLAGVQGPDPGQGARFVRIVDDMLAGMKGVAREMVHLRFLEHLTLQDCGHRLNVSRERIRQVEKKVLAELSARCRDEGWHGARVLDDGLIEFAELQAEGTSEQAFAPGLYVTLARATLNKAKGLRQIEAFYDRELEVLLDDLADSVSALAGCLTDAEIHQRAAMLTPALREWPPERLVQEARRRLGKAGRGGRARPRALLRALVRQAGGEISLAALRHKLEGLLAAGGHTRVLDDAALRALVQRSGEFYMRDSSTVACPATESEAQRAWLERAVIYILRGTRPTSLVRFLEQHSDCDVDEFALAGLLNRDPRVERVGRRLYCPANAAIDGPVRVLDILRLALESKAQPWTHRELLQYVKQRRDLRSNQIEYYLPRILDLVRYSAHCVGLALLSRPIMLQLFMTEQFVLDRFVALGGARAASLEDFWLDEAGDDDRLTPAEAQAIIQAASTWQGVRVLPGDPLRFVKEA